MTKDTKLKGRASKNREERRESLREELKSRSYIQQVHKILGEEWGEKVQENNGKLNAYFKLLNKTLPDVKAIELEGEVKTTPNLLIELTRE